VPAEHPGLAGDPMGSGRPKEPAARAGDAASRAGADSTARAALRAMSRCNTKGTARFSRAVPSGLRLDYLVTVTERP
jgi:hypothetical protein